MLVQRITYFPLVTEQIHKYLIQFVDSPGEMWLEYDGLPIKWFVCPVVIPYIDSMQAHPRRRAVRSDEEQRRDIAVANCRAF